MGCVWCLTHETKETNEPQGSSNTLYLLPVTSLTPAFHSFCLLHSLSRSILCLPNTVPLYPPLFVPPSFHICTVFPSVFLPTFASHFCFPPPTSLSKTDPASSASPFYLLPYVLPISYLLSVYLSLPPNLSLFDITCYGDAHSHSLFPVTYLRPPLPFPYIFYCLPSSFFFSLFLHSSSSLHLIPVSRFLHIHSLSLLPCFSSLPYLLPP